MSLAVVIVTYASGRIIEDCLRSLDHDVQDAGRFRVIVVDNASPDDTVDRVRAYGQGVELIETGRNGGFAFGVNAGLAAAQGCDVLVLNADIRLRPGAIGLLLKALEQPGVGIAVPKLLDENGALQLSLRRRPTVLRALGEAALGGFRAGRLPALGELVADPRDYRRARTVDWATGAAWLISRACAEALGPLDDRYFLYSEETEYMLRAGKHGFAVRYEPEAVAVHLGGDQVASDRLWALAAANRVRLHRQLYGRPRGALMRAAVTLNEASRAPARGRHRAAVKELLTMAEWPTPPGEIPAPSGYVCFSAQDWWYHNRAHSDFQLMRHMSAHRRVLVVNSIGMRMPMPGRSTHTLRRIIRKLRSVAKFVRRPAPGFHVMSPLPLPMYGSPLGRRINALLVRAQVMAVCTALGLRRPVIVVTLPTAWDVVRPMRRRALVFNRSDRHSAFPEGGGETIRAMESELLRRSDRIVYVSRTLMAEDEPLAGERAHFLDHGVDLEHFRRVPAERQPADLRGIPGPRVGFFGALDDFVVDFDLLERVALDLPEVSLVLIGDANGPIERLTRHPNVHWLGFKPYDQIPAYGSGFDVALMPWLDNDWIRHANPIKLKEYLALGLAIVSTDYGELAGYADRVRVGATPELFVKAIRVSLAEGPPRPPEALRVSVLGHDWSARAADLRALAERPPG
ncbi:glycosyltransferase [Nonomuraea africana]|uniref:GT2 family glycosyltransferase/glycosyltransferase involved in cell wall biosynthesis n=1 Tax=Nonomuraea africana TaxID=46171 RepID=A0ABR9KSK3_9ACTN|nr:glycosyltransferase [Nonomuraea africana]MBE1565019.1 GT2 family glycosyltransferase/glycosyltransferase involved in cell wall biosynthesis [Nonomuraea africana]